MKLTRLLPAAAGVLLLLVGCAVPRPPAAIDPHAAARWQAPLPHGGRLADLRQWWQQFNDPLLVDLVEAAQTASPTVAAAGTRIAEARAARINAGAARLPTVDGVVTSTRGNAQVGVPLSTITQAGLQASWEADLFGGNRSRQAAAQAQLAGSEAGWHEARVAVAAETASTYVDLRTCERLLAVTRNDAASRAETARLTQLNAQAGFAAPAAAAQARASAADGAQRATQQQAQCEVLVKGLVAVSGIPEPDLRRRLAAPWVEPVGFATLQVPSVPADLLSQRPDVYQAARSVEAASFDIGAARADRLPRLTLSGQVGLGLVHAGGQTTTVEAWQIGPVTLNLPIFDAGRRAAAVDTAQARYDEAVTGYGARVRQAVREVEEALVNLDSARSRSENARIAAEGYRTSFVAAEARYRNGLGNLFEVEDARRVLLSAEIALANLQRDRLAAWISLYRALGGGWTAPQDAAPATASAR